MNLVKGKHMLWGEGLVGGQVSGQGRRAAEAGRGTGLKGKKQTPHGARRRGHSEGLKAREREEC